MRIIITILFSSLLGCMNTEKTSVKEENLENRILEEWIYTTKVEGLSNDGKIIDKPVGLEQLVMKLTLFSEDGSHLKTHCVYYKVPFKNMLGIIKIEEIKNESMCPVNSSDELWAQVGDVENFRPRLENFKLTFDFNKNKKKFNWIIPMPNISGGIFHEKYQASIEKKLYPNMTLLRVADNNINYGNNEDQYYLGRISDSFSNGQSKRCFQINKDCEQVGEDLCERCRYGWFEVVDYSCPKGGSRFCGQNHCGEKNEPACPRGTRVASQDDELGICQNDLTPVRNSDHILVCQ